MRRVIPPPEWAPEIDQWCISLRAAGKPETTISLRRYHISRLGAALGGSPWRVTGEDIVEWVGRREWGVETRRSWRSSMRAFWAWAVDTGRATASPAEALPSVKPKPPAPHPTPAQVWRQALEEADPRSRLMLRLAGEMGMRRGEVARVHGNDVVDDLLGQSLIVHGKGGKARTVPMPASLAREVRRACLAGGGWAFPGQVDGHLSAQRVGRIVSNLMPDGIAMHSLRHRFATLAFEVDHDLLAVQELLGHASVETTRRYVLLNRARLRRTVDAVAA